MYQVLYEKEHLDAKSLEKQFATRANYARNKTKHVNPIIESSIDVDPQEEARDMLNRALDNWWALGQPFNRDMLEFTNAQRNV